MANAAYSVSVELLLTGGMAAALTGVISQLTRIHTQVGQINQGFTSWRTALGVGGAAALGAGVGIAAGLWEIAKAGDAILRVQNQMRMQGQAASTIQAVTNQAFIDTGKGVGRVLNPAEYMAQWKFLAFATGDPKMASSLMERSAGVSAILMAAMAKEGRTITPTQLEASTDALWKLLEEQNLLSPSRRADAYKVIEGLARDVAITGGKVTPEAFRSNILYGRRAASGWFSPEALAEDKPFALYYLPWLIQSMSTGRGGIAGVGNALDTMFANVALGRMSDQTKEEWKRIGWLQYDPNPEGERGRRGRRRYGGAFPIVRGHELMTRNPYLLIQALVHDLIRQGYNTQVKMTEEISHLIGTKTGAAAALLEAFGGLQWQTMGARVPWHRMHPYFELLGPAEKHARMLTNAPSYEALVGMAQQQPDIMAFMMEKQKERMWQAIGMIWDPFRLQVIDKITNLFTSLGNLARTPEGIQGLMAFGEALAGVAAGLAVLGSAALIGLLISLAGPGGLLFAAAAAFGAMSEPVRHAVSALIDAAASGDQVAAKAAAWKLAMVTWDELNKKSNEAMAQFQSGIRSLASELLSWAAKMLGVGQPHPFTDYYRRLHPHSLLQPEPWGGVEPIKPYLGPQRTNLGGFGWEPRGGGGPMHVHNVIQLDGSAIAKAVNDYMIADLEHPKQAPYFDGRSGHTPPDWQPIT